MRVSACVVLLALVAGAARAATDADLEKARIHSRAGSAYYEESRYDDAAREIETAYRIKPIAELQYNLAECYERLGRSRDAVRAYQRYLDGKPDADDRNIVAWRIKNLHARGDRADAAPREKVVLKTIIVYRALPPPPGRAARGAAYGAIVLGVAGLATGIAASVLAAQAARDEQSADNPLMPPPFDGNARDAQTRLQSYQIVAGVAYGVAVLGGVAGGVLYWLGGKIDREAKKLQLSAALSSTTVGLIARGAF